ncbi:hypothetical protein WR25_02423 [Diploscapter pachys]|uniref:Bromo domain-containing protein n=1 Tax=Diploscapter pachys TaxID=2018661 RepID=A0A2A2KKM9_9BILA|nr:hypothetical protein WR25_02423 [Diploscapter pachys]
MDLKTLMNKLKQRVYDTPEEAREDFNLIVTNCKTYNEEGSEIYECAQEMEEFLKLRLDAIFQERKSSRRH